jgi:hypothetical protein
MVQIPCTRCGRNMPELRLTRCGYSTCISCSNTQPVGCIPVTNHKTGNTIQVVPLDVANNINRLAQRKGYGVMSGMKHN